MRVFQTLIAILRVTLFSLTFQNHGRVSDFKFTNEEKTEAFVKFTNQTQAYLVEALTSEGSQLTEDAHAKFKVRVKGSQSEEEKSGQEEVSRTTSQN